ncbi:MAG: hypothetical protein HY748_03655 [Elusimicrobia bacterium]|nr:hypothetical protein [Elusimicrobiota bacterium]
MKKTALVAALAAALTVPVSHAGDELPAVTFADIKAMAATFPLRLPPAVVVSDQGRVVTESEVGEAIQRGMPQPAEPGRALMGRPSFQSGPLIARFELKTLLDSQLETDVAFKLADGLTVRVAGTKVGNCSDGGTDCNEMFKYFFLFRADAGELLGASAFDIANFAMVKRGSKDLKFANDPAAYTARLFVKSLDRDSVVKTATLEIAKNKAVVLKFPVTQMLDSMKSRGRPVRLHKEFLLFYGRDLLQNSKKDVYPDPKEGTTFVLMAKDNQDEYYPIPASSINATGVTFPAMAPGYVFRAAGGFLEIYRP